LIICISGSSEGEKIQLGAEREKVSGCRFRCKKKRKNV
jgi:hypothetical protein